MTDASAPVLSSDNNELYNFTKTELNLNDRSYFGPKFSDLRPVDDQELKENIRKYYSIDKILHFLRSNKLEDGSPKYKAITLQFPDELISDSAIIVQLLQEGLEEVGSTNTTTSALDPTETQDEIDFTSLAKKSCSEDIETVHKKCSDKKDGLCTCDKKKTEDSSQKIWILADTSYSPCCVDEVALEHVGADLVVHFGDACLNPIEKLPAVFVFGKPYLDHLSVKKRFGETYGDDKEAKICLMSDAPYSHHILELYRDLKNEYPNLVYADIFNTTNSTMIDHDERSEELGSNFIKTGNRVIGPLYKDSSIELDTNSDLDLDALTQEYQLFHIKLPPSPRLIELSTKFSTITTYDPKTNTTSQGPYPSLMKRYRFMHIARTAGTIGILVNTLSLSNTKTMLNTVTKWIKNAGKKHYTFVVGKPNVAKLANFESIDIWCVLGCGQSGIIIDNVGDYYKPIITPYELQMALKDELTWTGKWVVDFQEVMQIGQEEEEAEDDGNGDDQDDYGDEAPEFDLVTGKFVSTSRPLRRYVQHLSIGDEPENVEQVEEDALVKKLSSLVAIKGTVSTSAITLQNRHWAGLGSDFQKEDVDEEGALVEEGRGGVARGYDFDRENNTNK